jgi:aerobic-type carbon monoxide dehydrogenase small subunit (CoxS/CutS family)
LPAAEAQDQAAPGLERIAAGGAPLELVLNGEKRALSVEPRTTLLDLLRQKLNVTGAKEVCDRGACGACTVLVDGKPVVSCMVLAHDCSGKRVETVEGVGSPESPHPFQRELVACDGLQCGFCTPGMVMSMKALLDRTTRPTDDEIQHAVSGNICRCGTYPRIFEAARKAATSMAAAGTGGGK